MSNILRYVLDKYPKSCDNCPFFSRKPYRSHNEVGFMAVCDLGYHKGHDTRDMNSLYDLCSLENDERVGVECG